MKLSKTIFITTAIFGLFLSFFFVTAPVHQVSANTLDPWGGFQDNIQATTGLGDRDPREIVASVIQVALGFLGIIAVLIILYAGFLWMTAAGNDDKIATAKSMLSAGIIGLVIILAAFGLAKFVVNELSIATS